MEAFLQGYGRVGGCRGAQGTRWVSKLPFARCFWEGASPGEVWGHGKGGGGRIGQIPLPLLPSLCHSLWLSDHGNPHPCTSCHHKGCHPHLEPQLGAPRGSPNSLHPIIQLAKRAQRKRGHQSRRGFAAWGQGSIPGDLLLQGGSLWEQSRESDGCSVPPLVSHHPVAVVIPPPNPLPQAGVLCRGQGRGGGTSLRSSSLVIMTMRGTSSCHTISQKSVTVFGMGPWVAMYSRGRPA